MDKVTREELKQKIIQNFLKFIESKPELKRDDMIKDAFTKLKSSVASNK